jgi:hypothetical protein
MPKLKQHVGLDVSLEETSIAVIDENEQDEILRTAGSAAM